MAGGETRQRKKESRKPGMELTNGNINKLAYHTWEHDSNTYYSPA